MLRLRSHKRKAERPGRLFGSKLHGMSLQLLATSCGILLRALPVDPEGLFLSIAAKHTQHIDVLRF